MDEKRILFVEDDAGQRELFMDAVKDWNSANNPRRFIVTTCEAVDEAKDALSFGRFDCALFDLRLPPSRGKGKSSAEGGNELARLGFRDHGIPVGVISGNPADFDEDLLKTGLLKPIFKGKGKPYEEAVAWFVGLWGMMDVLASVRAKLQLSGADVFSRRVWPQWKEYEKLKSGGDDLSAIVTRQYAGHIAELLGIDHPDNPGWHPFENYISPALQEDRPHTGDIFELDGEMWVILSPQCDMAAGKISNVILAHCDRKALEPWEAKVAELIKAGDAAGEKLKRFFSDLVNQNGEPSRHFLPPLNGGRPIMVSFKELSTRPLAELKASLDKRVASVSPPFLPNLTQRFGAYISRAGQPNIDVRHFTDV